MFMRLSTDRNARDRDRQEGAQDDDDEDDAGLGSPSHGTDDLATGFVAPEAVTARSAMRASLAGDRCAARDDLMLASSRQRSCVASARDSSPTISPSATTRMRSLMLRTSGSSDEMRMMPMPSCASSSMSAWTSALAPTSMPRVGSSRMRTCGLQGQPLGERDLLLVAAGQPADEVLEVGRADLESVAVRRDHVLRRRRRSTMPARVIWCTTLIEMLSRDGHLREEALALAVLGDVADAQAHGLLGRADDDRLHRRASIVPLS